MSDARSKIDHLVWDIACDGYEQAARNGALVLDGEAIAKYTDSFIDICGVFLFAPEVLESMEEANHYQFDSGLTYEQNCMAQNRMRLECAFAEVFGVTCGGEGKGHHE